MKMPENVGRSLSPLRRFLEPRIAVALAACCAAAGLFTVYASVAMLLDIWRTDDLKSMGLVVPFVSFALILRAWRGIGWKADGSWWGFCILAGSAALMFLRDRTLLIVTVNKNWLLQLPPLPLVAVVYAMGMVLLFGGKRLLRAAWFPVLFMWAVIPVPQTFSKAVDLPLQHISATVARAFAQALGQPLTQDKLRLMFTPEFGMFIAPGCNGIRGAITLGMAAVVVGISTGFGGICMRRWWLGRCCWGMCLIFCGCACW
jgi:exosortase J